MSVVTKAGPLGSLSQSSAAASFFARTKDVSRAGSSVTGTSLVRQASNVSSEEEREVMRTSFRSILTRAAPCLPRMLVSRLETGLQQQDTVGKVRELLRLAAGNTGKHIQVDGKRRQVTLLDPSSVGRQSDICIEERRVGVAAPKMFAFDGVFEAGDSQDEVSGAAVSDLIAGVISGHNDGCVFSLGHSGLGQSWTMLGEDDSAGNIGVLPRAVSWLYRSIKETRSRTGARFSVRVSA